MSNEYDFKPEEPKRTPKPGDPDFVPPPVIIEKEAPQEEAPLPPDPDVENNKGMAILGYILFLVPLVAAPKSDYAKYHANQGLLVFICWIIAVVAVVALWAATQLLAKVAADITMLYYFFSCLFHVLQAALLISPLVLIVLGILNAANGEKKPLPIVGQIKLLK